MKSRYHQLVGNLRVKGQIQNKDLLVHLAIYQAAKPLEPQKVHHLGKGQLGWVGSRKKFRRNIRAYIVPVELHEKCHNAMVAAVLIRQRRFDGGFGLLRQFLRPIQHFTHRIHGNRIRCQFFLYIEEKGQPRFLGKVEYLLAGCICKINAFTVQLHRDASSLVFQMG